MRPIHRTQGTFFLQALLRFPLGDMQSRLELEKPFPDLKVVYQAFIQGRNRPEDVKGMAILYRRFSRHRYMADAVAIWTEGDSLIAELQILGDRLHREISYGSQHSGADDSMKSTVAPALRQALGFH